ncbi:hypothetical protein R1sor_011811 [Riccia sorocarpa]|uniref:Uncharacterized protein n=1 Tax=Riccia sorocarpa TaxID=122646 RepID=A0ABD3I5K6_9MARC
MESRFAVPCSSEVSCTTITRYAGDKVLRSKIMVQASPKAVQEIKSPKSPRNSSTTRWNLLGLCLPFICYLLSPLLNRDVRHAPRRICPPENIKESECSAMDPGEVWALYNGHQRPNWYAVIVNRSGDRNRSLDLLTMTAYQFRLVMSESNKAKNLHQLISE